MHKQSPADELADLRVEMARLEHREAVLRKMILNAPEAAQGRWHRAEVEETVTRVFDPRLLPDDVREDPQYWRERVTQVVRCLPVSLGRPAPRVGWPIQIGRGMH